ncbi:MAG: rod shape-determining protein MreD, partial [Pseudomonadota bacterium]
VCALALLFVQAMVRSQSRLLYGKSFEILWLGFVLIAGAATVLRWAIMSLMNDTLVSPEPVLFHFLSTAALFPLLATLILRMQQTILKQV